MANDNEGIRDFIYGAYRYGIDMRDVYAWIADDLGVARTDAHGDAVPSELYAVFFARYASDEALQENFARFMKATYQEDFTRFLESFEVSDVYTPGSHVWEGIAYRTKCARRKSAAVDGANIERMDREADEVLFAARAFFSKMVDWQKRVRASFPARGAVREELRNDLERIFREHLTQKTASREQRRYATLDHNLPLEFAHAITGLEPAEPGAWWLQVEHWISGRMRFHFVKHQGIWKIDYYLAETRDGEWEKRHEF